MDRQTDKNQPLKDRLGAICDSLLSKPRLSDWNLEYRRVKAVLLISYPTHKHSKKTLFDAVVFREDKLSDVLSGLIDK